MEPHQEPQDETPTKTLETPDNPFRLPSPPLPPQQPSETSCDADANAGGEDPRDAKPSSSEISDLEKKQRRAERFGVPVQLSEEEKRSSRAERFGTGSAASGRSEAKKVEEDKRKARAERFGLPGQALGDEEMKKKARLERFGVNQVPTNPEEEEKRKARALRFSGTSNAASETNGKDKTELKAVVTETDAVARTEGQA